MSYFVQEFVFFFFRFLFDLLRSMCDNDRKYQVDEKERQEKKPDGKKNQQWHVGLAFKNDKLNDQNLIIFDEKERPEKNNRVFDN